MAKTTMLPITAVSLLAVILLHLPSGMEANAIISKPPDVVYFAPPEKVSAAWTIDDGAIAGATIMWLTYKLSFSLRTSNGVAAHHILTSTTDVRKVKDYGRIEFFFAGKQAIFRYNSTIGDDGGVYSFAFNTVYDSDRVQLISIGNEDDRTSGPFTRTPPSKIYLMSSQNITLQNLSLVWSHNFTGITIMQVKIVYKGLKGWEELVTYSKSQSTTQSPSNIHRVHRATVQGRLHFHYGFNQTILTFDNITAADAGMYGFVAFDENGWAFKFIRSRVELIMGVPPSTSIIPVTSTAIASSTYQSASISSSATTQYLSSIISHKPTFSSVDYSEGLEAVTASPSKSLVRLSAIATSMSYYKPISTRKYVVYSSKIITSLSDISSRSRQQSIQASAAAATTKTTTTTPTTPTMPKIDKKGPADTSTMVASVLGLTLGLSIGIPVGALLLLIGGTCIYFIKVKLKTTRVHPIFKN